MSDFVTIQMLAKHARKTELTVRRALKAAGVKREKSPGVRGLRITRIAANKFLGRQWPEVGPLPDGKEPA